MGGGVGGGSFPARAISASNVKSTSKKRKKAEIISCFRAFVAELGWGALRSSALFSAISALKKQRWPTQWGHHLIFLCKDHSFAQHWRIESGFHCDG